VNRSADGGGHQGASSGHESVGPDVGPNNLDPDLDPAVGLTDLDPEVDPDIGREDQVAPPSRSPGLLAAIAAGGILGAEGRYGLSVALPHADQQFPWSTLIINVTGCLLIGVLMTVLLSMPSPHRLIRPFLGVGVLGGYTTYSGFASDAQRLVLQHRPLVALSYVVLTLLAGAGAVWFASALTARIVTRQGEPAGLMEHW
jgi:fluoride exporter